MVLIGSQDPGRSPFDVSLKEVLGIVCGGIAGASVVEVTLLGIAQPDVAVAINQVASRGRPIPYRELDGPRFDTYHHRVINRIDSTDSDPRWPEFCRGAKAAGVHSILSYPLVFAGGDLGTLCAYSNVDSAFSDQVQLVGAVFASLTSAIVARASVHPHPPR
jgi:GAF domain-containing protein